jgi:DNA-binding NarL/FixJ family response regulator
MFVVQESTHADHVSRHDTREEAIAAIHGMIRAGLGDPGDFNIREVDPAGRTVSVFQAPMSVDTSLLSSREHEVLKLIAEGRSTEEIAKELSISSRTARVHVKRALEKLGIESEVGAAATARD